MNTVPCLHLRGVKPFSSVFSTIQLSEPYKVMFETSHLITRKTVLQMTLVLEQSQFAHDVAQKNEQQTVQSDEGNYVVQLP